MSWTSPASVGAELLQLLSSPLSPHAAPAERWQRSSMASLACALADAQSAPALERLARAPGEPWDTRACALVRLRALSVEAPGLLADLLREGAALAAASEPSWPHHNFELRRVLRAAHAPDEIEAARQHLGALEAGERLYLLRSSLDGELLLAPELHAFLLARYQAGDHAALEPHQFSAGLLAETWELPEIHAKLAGWLADRTPEREELLVHLPSEAVESLCRVTPGLEALAIEHLALPLGALVAALGEAELLRRLERVVRRLHLSCRLPRQVMPAPPGVARAADLLVRWPQARGHLWRLLCDLQLESGARMALLRPLWLHEPDGARRWALAAVRHPENELLVRLLAARLARQAKPEDAELLSAILTSGMGRWAQLNALLGLEHIGAAPAAVLGLVDSDSLRLRLKARAVLARAGDEASRLALLAWAERGEHPLVRAEAARALGRAGAVEHTERLAALLVPQAEAGLGRPEARVQLGVAEALARLGTPYARTALLCRGWLWVLELSLRGEFDFDHGELDDSTWADVETGWN